MKKSKIGAISELAIKINSSRDMKLKREKLKQQIKTTVVPNGCLIFSLKTSAAYVAKTEADLWSYGIVGKPPIGDTTTRESSLDRVEDILIKLHL